MNVLLDEKKTVDSLKKSEKFDLLIISPSKFLNPLYKLAKHKKKYGFDAKIVTLKEIYKGIFFPINGIDKPEQIKCFIKNALDSWNIKYVLLVGGAKQIPVRYIHNLAKDPELDFLERRIISDLYYADIYDSKGTFSNWDTNGNGLYGEWTGGTAEDKNIDLRPDIFIGRLPCRNRFEVKIMVNKIINYETETYGKQWFKNIVVAGGDTYPENDGIYEGEIDAEKALNNMKKFNHIKLWASTNDLKVRGSFKIIKEVNKGCGFLVLAGHGNPIFWSTHLPNDIKKISKFSIYKILFLFNRNMLPICISNGCRNSTFDTSIINFFKNPKESWNKSFDFAPGCWSWALTRKIGGGAIATLGSTGLVYIKWDKETGGMTEGWSYILERFFWEYNVNRTELLGEIWGKVIIDYLKKYPINWNSPSLCYNSESPKPDAINARTVQGFILFGDPTLKIGGYRKVFK
jgi:hypothetical protein